MSQSRLKRQQVVEFMNRLCPSSDNKADDETGAWKMRAILECDLPSEKVFPDYVRKKSKVIERIQKERESFEPGKTVANEHHALETTLRELGTKIGNSDLSAKLFLFSFGPYIFYLTSPDIVVRTREVQAAGALKSTLRALLYALLKTRHQKTEDIAAHLLRRNDLRDSRTLEAHLRKARLTDDELRVFTSVLSGEVTHSKNEPRFDATVCLPENLPAIRFWFGRDTDLQRAIKNLESPDTKNFAIVGAAGVGKSSLASQIVRTAMSTDGYFQKVAWESFSGGSDNQTPPSIHTVLECLLNRLDETDLPRDTLSRESARLKTRRLLRVMKNYRCLIVLDNIETVLSRGEGGR